MYNKKSRSLNLTKTNSWRFKRRSRIKWRAWRPPPSMHNRKGKSMRWPQVYISRSSWSLIIQGKSRRLKMTLVECSKTSVVKFVFNRSKNMDNWWRERRLVFTKSNTCKKCIKRLKRASSRCGPRSFARTTIGSTAPATCAVSASTHMEMPSGQQPAAIQVNRIMQKVNAKSAACRTTTPIAWRMPKFPASPREYRSEAGASWGAMQWLPPTPLSYAQQSSLPQVK